MKLGLNAVLFGGYDLETAFRCTAMAGYQGIEISPLTGMADHLDLDTWPEQVEEIKELAGSHHLELTAMEVATPDAGRVSIACDAAQALGIPVVNIGSGGRSGDEEAWEPAMENLRHLAGIAGSKGVILCVKAHVGLSVFNTETTIRALDEVPDLYLDMDPSHIIRAGEDPVAALGAVVERMRHVHIRDCKVGDAGGGAASGSGAAVAPIPPGSPQMQTNGRGDIDLIGYIRVLHEAGYAGPVNLEVIGAKDLDLLQCQTIAAESRGHMQACLQACGAV